MEQGTGRGMGGTGQELQDEGLSTCTGAAWCSALLPHWGVCCPPRRLPADIGGGPSGPVLRLLWHLCSPFLGGPSGERGHCR